MRQNSLAGKYYGANQNPNRHINDLYTTDPKVVRELIEIENIKGLTILENCAGMGHMAEELKKDNHVITNDKYFYGYTTDYQLDFLKEKLPINCNIDAVVINPPFKHSYDFIMESFKYSNKVYVFEKLTFLEGVARHNKLFSLGHLEKVYVYSYRPKCNKGGNKLSGLMLAWAWYCFDLNYHGLPTLDWIYRGKVEYLN